MEFHDEEIGSGATDYHWSFSETRRRERRKNFWSRATKFYVTPWERLTGGRQNGSPAAFEQIVVDLFVAMGYGGSVVDAGKVVGKSGDGGIDGTIKQDKLGLDFLYVQAKRWKDVVGSPEIMKFSGSLTKKRRRGVFSPPHGFLKTLSNTLRRCRKGSSSLMGGGWPR